MYPEKLHILLAEDDTDDRLLFEDAFNDVKIKYTLIIFDNGSDLVAYLHDSDILPHIIFLNLNIPGKTGLECLQEIRNNSRLKDISVAIYSTCSNNTSVEETFIAGANIYIKKTGNFTALKKIISDVVHINWQYVTDGLNRENFMISY
ncbi:response regulator [Flavobacterium cyanobacteriorum]|uniref:Response regulator n=1 Tax=Flavobacterium cyanobacteriorum TaxID=2022802 RepID=A0A255Z4D8_9FLAO|nr:response regulator [Flavobacterium cyanobacteriorum]OYQ36326.1 response regulator [Flavobacterium cyanobacteriorum]